MADGVVTAVAEGKATITAIVSGVKAECAVTMIDPTITMTTAITGEAGFHLRGTGTAIIDWGDGSAPETVILSAVDRRLIPSHRCTRTFPDTTSRTIIIDGQNITRLVCGRLGLIDLDVTKNTALTYLWCDNNRLTSLDVGNNTALTHLTCAYNRLTALDVSNNTALTYLECDYNRLTAEGINALFDTLHSNTGNKMIYIDGNPGTADCDRSIATNKGWTAQVVD